MTRTLLLLAGLACVLVVACTEKPEDYVLASAIFSMPQDQGIYDNEEIVAPTPAPLFTGCYCQAGHWGRELRASMCSYGPEEEGYARRECLYQRGNSILTRPLESYPL